MKESEGGQIRAVEGVVVHCALSLVGLIRDEAS